MIRCPDRRGIVAAVSAFLAERGANIIESDQYSTDPEGGEFFLRMAFHLPGLAASRGDLERDWAETVAGPFDMDWRLTEAAERKRVALMASREEHCLLDLLWRARRGELPIEVGLVISNHSGLAADVAAFDVAFEQIPVAPQDKATAESRQLELLAGRFDLIILARYMQILSADFLARVGCPVINIHHSFLPSFAGAQPYRQAREHGVKLVGATAHYVTEQLDEGPIIEQDVVRVTHRATEQELARRGADVERLVLARAVQWHCEDRVIRHENMTVVFA